MDVDAFTKTVEELKSTLFHLIFYFQGEPLLNKKLPEMIAYAHQSGIFTSTSTNGQLLNSATAKALVQSGLDKIIISVDGTNQKTYQKYRKGGRLELALEGITHLNFWKKELNSNTPFVEIQMVIFKTNEHQIGEMRILAKNLNVNRLTFKSAQLHNFENGHELLTTIDKYARYKMLPNGKYALKNKLHNRCFRLWSGAVVTAKGDVLPCCFDKDTSHSFGNVVEADFNSIIQNSKANYFRTSILTNRKQYEMCRNCTAK
jgi:radical SAM protein with 4Fe4S-binding SPASM domain